MNVLVFPGFLDDTWSSIEERYLWLDAPLRAEGDCHWLVPWRAGAPEPRYSAELGRIGARTIKADLRPGTPIRNFRRLSRIFQAHRIDLVYTHFGPLRHQVEAAARMRGVRVARGEHNFAFHSDRRFRFAKRLFWRWAVDHFVPVSQAVATHLAEAGVMRGNGTVVHDGFDLARYPAPAKAESRNDVLRELEITGQPHLLACVAKLPPAKQQHLLVEMMAQLGMRNVVLLLAGGIADAPYAAGLQARVRSLGLEGRIRFLGYRNDVARLMDAADITYLPSRVEGLGNVVVESCIMETPVIAADLPAIREIIDNGRNGYLVEGDAVPDYVRLTDRLLGDDALRRRMGAEGRVGVAGRFGRQAFERRSVEALRAAFNGART